MREVALVELCYWEYGVNGRVESLSSSGARICVNRVLDIRGLLGIGVGPRLGCTVPILVQSEMSIFEWLQVLVIVLPIEILGHDFALQRIPQFKFSPRPEPRFGVGCPELSCCLP